jgi:hypothetical protein
LKASPQAKGKGTPGGRPTVAQATKKARTLRSVFRKLGLPPDDPIQAQKWAARAARMAADAFFTGKMPHDTVQQVRGVVKMILATVGPEQLADLDAALKAEQGRANQPRHVVLKPTKRAKEGQPAHPALRGSAPRAAKPE